MLFLEFCYPLLPWINCLQLIDASKCTQPPLLCTLFHDLPLPLMLAYLMGAPSPNLVVISCLQCRQGRNAKWRRRDLFLSWRHPPTPSRGAASPLFLVLYVNSHSGRTEHRSAKGTPPPLCLEVDRIEITSIWDTWTNNLLDPIYSHSSFRSKCKKCICNEWICLMDDADLSVIMVIPSYVA